MKKEVLVYTISDSLGETSQKLLAAVSAQYPTLTFDNSYRFPFVSQEEELLEILRDALKDDAIVISTLVNAELASKAKAFSTKNGLQYLDLMAPFFELVQDKTGERPIEQPGLVHKLDQTYFNKIEAIEFAVKYDDGKHPQGFVEADIVILGVSRTSKTPLSMYLANKDYKVANLPLIPEVPIPQSLSEVSSKRIIGLICSADNLMKIRNSRLDSLGLNSTSSYTNLEKIQAELAYSQQIFKDYGAYVIDVSDKSVEETAHLIEEYLRSVDK
ncbi:pyruvate, water dikinase regulatory protein [Vagococcus xieshaowenii]|uniref:Putative pyruvate, phosphate dikinase regulatory protein n=1 Tax=Vagococcus xieshaowenii TaxID=2562451 RepID=A0AAJ5EE97_9ENTE|nr:pyruvate, water dikinase regulatory protein [Vagococcus xieshaowenii]QCA29402.1 kinase/pyrophosphorylase [Vagococcus xieshaowenii]TFZ39305.1 kinase/pyrophosphorylase [Vagococcus xieshaowenii]